MKILAFYFNTKSNHVLLTKIQYGYFEYDFTHERNLIITSEDKTFYSLAVHIEE